MRNKKTQLIKKIVYILYQPYKWLFFLPFLILSTCFFVFTGVIIIILANDRIANRTTGVWWSRINSYLIPMFVTVVGRENIRKDQSFVIVANHQSNLDIFLLFGWLGIDVKWVIKKELRRVPVFGYAAEKGGNILIDRSNPKSAYRSLERAREKIQGGTSIVILPEGTRSVSGEMGSFKRGPFQMAIDLNLPMLPVTIANTKHILPAGTLKLFPGRATMQIHQPVNSSQYEADSIEEFRDHVKAVIQGGLDTYQKKE